MFFMSTKSTKSTKTHIGKQATFIQMFFMRIKSIKSATRKQVTFLLLDVFIAHKNVVFYTQKSTKSTKRK